MLLSFVNSILFIETHVVSKACTADACVLLAYFLGADQRIAVSDEDR